MKYLINQVETPEKKRIVCELGSILVYNLHLSWPFVMVLHVTFFSLYTFIRNLCNLIGRQDTHNINYTTIHGICTTYKFKYVVKFSVFIFHSNFFDFEFLSL